MECALELRSLRKSYGDLVAVEGLDLRVARGEVLGLLGPNGAGKSTTVSMVCGLLRPDSGDILVGGRSLLGAGGEGLKRSIGLCPQSIVVWDRLGAGEQLLFVASLYGIREKAARARRDLLLEALGLEGKRDAQARTLSGGMQRRLNIALALVHDPEIVILDEPEAGLDPASKVRTREFIVSLAESKAVLLCTHDMDEAERLCDRVAVIDSGRLLAVDSPAALMERGGKDGGRARDLEEVFLAMTGRRLAE